MPRCSPSGDAGAGGVKVKRPVGLNFDDVTGAQRRMGVGHSDQVVVLECQVQAGLVAKMLDPFHKRIKALTLSDLLGSQADLGGLWRGVWEDVSGQDVDARLAKTAGGIDTDRLCVDFARRAELHQTAMIQHAARAAG